MQPETAVRWPPPLLPAFVIAAIACSLSIARVDAASPETDLREQGLIPSASVWILPAETEVRNHLADLPKLREAILNDEKILDETIQTNRRAWDDAQPILAALKKQLSRLSTGDRNRQAVQQQINALQQSATPPDKLAGRADVRAQIALWIQHRNQLTLRLLSARQQIPQIQAEYRHLSRSGEVQRALAQLGGDHHLGPLRPLQPELRRLTEYDPLVFTLWVPIYLQSAKFRTAVIFNERQPITITWSADGKHGTVLTASAAQSLGIAPTAEEPTQTLSFNKRKVTARRAKVESLRLGQIVIPEAPVWILTAEGEDLGSQLDPTSLTGYEAHLQPEQLRLNLRRGTGG